MSARVARSLTHTTVLRCSQAGFCGGGGGGGGFASSVGCASDPADAQRGEQKVRHLGLHLYPRYMGDQRSSVGAFRGIVVSNCKSVVGACQACTGNWCRTVTSSDPQWLHTRTCLPTPHIMLTLPQSAHQLFLPVAGALPQRWLHARAPRCLRGQTPGDVCPAAWHMATHESSGSHHAALSLSRTLLESWSSSIIDMLYQPRTVSDHRA